MKKVIRRGVFETNSSTSHSLIVMSQEQYDKWEKEKFYFFHPSEWWNPFEKLPVDQQPVKDTLYSKAEVERYMKLIGDELEPDEDEDDEYYFDNLAEEDSFYSYESFMENEYLESEANDYTTPSGEKLVICCKYGRDG